MKQKNYGIQEVYDKDGALTSRFKTVTSKREAKSSVGLILTGFIEPDKEYLVQELGREDKYLMITKVKPPQIPESIEIIDAKKENTVSNSNNKVKNTPQTINPADFNVDEKETLGFITPLKLITNLINLIALPLNNQCEFDKIVLHFDNSRKEIWWSNRVAGGIFLANFGHATYDYFVNCWGDGEIAIEANRFLKYLRQIIKAEQVIFVAYPKKKRYKINLDGKIENFNERLETISEVHTHTPRIDYEKNKSDYKMKLDDDYIPIFKREIAALPYGGIIKASELKRIVKKGGNIRNYPVDFKINPPALIVTFGDATSQTNIQKMEIKFKEGSIKPLDMDISKVISEKLKAPAMVLKGEVILRFSKKEDAPVYLLKIEKSEVNPNGVMFAGILIAAKEKTVNRVPQDMPEIEISTQPTPNIPEQS